MFTEHCRTLPRSTHKTLSSFPVLHTPFSVLFPQSCSEVVNSCDVLFLPCRPPLRHAQHPLLMTCVCPLVLACRSKGHKFECKPEETRKPFDLSSLSQADITSMGRNIVQAILNCFMDELSVLAYTWHRKHGKGAVVIFSPMFFHLTAESGMQVRSSFGVMYVPEARITPSKCPLRALFDKVAPGAGTFKLMEAGLTKAAKHLESYKPLESFVVYAVDSTYQCAATIPFRLTKAAIAEAVDEHWYGGDVSGYDLLVVNPPGKHPRVFVTFN